MRKINLIFQEILKFILLFLFLFVWFRYFVKRLSIAFICTLFASGIIYGIFTFLNHKKQQKTSLKLKEKEEAENMFLSMACNDKRAEFFVNLAKKRYGNIIKHKDFIVVNHEDKSVKTILFLDFSFEGLTIAKFISIYNKIRKEKATKIVICCKEIAEKQLLTFCQNFDEKFLILNEYDTYQKLYKEYDCFPEITHKYKKEKKLVLKDFIAYSFNKKRTKGYLFSSIILILSSLFMRTSLYYCIIASLLVVFAIISQFNPYFNTKKEVEIL